MRCVANLRLMVPRGGRYDFFAGEKSRCFERRIEAASRARLPRFADLILEV